MSPTIREHIFSLRGDWHPTSLTFNLGLRYDYGTPIVGGEGTRLANFNLNTLALETEAPFYAPDRNDVGPRIGILERRRLAADAVRCYGQVQVGGLGRLQLRVEMFNVLNKPIWAATPQRTFLSPASFRRVINTFGRTESFGTARQIQLAVRYDF